MFKCGRNDGKTEGRTHSKQYTPIKLRFAGGGGGIMSIRDLVKFCPFILIIWSKIQRFMSIKGHDSVVNLQKTKIYITNVDLVNDNVYTKVGLHLSIRFQDMEQNQILTSIRGHNSVAKNNDLQQQGRSCQ